MKRSDWLAIIGGLLAGLPASRALAQVPTVARDMTVTVGVEKKGTECRTFQDDSEANRKLKKTETLHLKIENKCGRKWNIRIDRFPGDSFAAACRFAGTPFDFEKDNLFQKGERRLVNCLVQADHRVGRYNFLVSETDPSKPDQAAVDPKQRPFTHNLAIEVDP